MPVYRYKGIFPGKPSIDREVDLSNPVTVLEHGAPYIDVTAVVGEKDDLDEYMASRGFSFVATDPTDNPVGWQTIDYVEGFVADTDPALRRGYTLADPLSATESFTAVVVLSPTTADAAAGAPQQAFGVRGTASDAAGGWGIQIESAAAAGALGNVQVRATFASIGGGPSTRMISADIQVLVAKWTVIHFTVASVSPAGALTLRLYVNGSAVAQFTSGDAGGQYTPGGSMSVGVYDGGVDSSNSAGFPGRIHGAGYATSVMTDAEIAAHVDAIQEAGELVQTPGGTALANGWRADVAAVEPGAATWPSFLAGAALTTVNATALTLATKAPPVVWT
jgi:hypothetical protein